MIIIDVAVFPEVTMIVNYNARQSLPTSEDLPYSDDTPVDNELQNHIPNLLLAILALVWPDRQDWFFGADMGIYYDWII